MDKVEWKRFLSVGRNQIEKFPQSEPNKICSAGDTKTKMEVRFRIVRLLRENDRILENVTNRIANVERMHAFGLSIPICILNWVACQQPKVLVKRQVMFVVEFFVTDLHSDQVFYRAPNLGPFEGRRRTVKFIR